MVLNPMGKDNDALVRIDLFCNKLYKFIPVLTTKHMNEYEI
jgi:hypothetical protein